MKFKRSQMAVAVASVLGLLAVAAHAQDAALERVTVTGSNIKRTQKEGTSPIDTITAADIKESGAKTVLELMKQIPSMGTDGYNDIASQNSFSRGVATASLRSLSATSTLVLLNGRRLTPSAYANPNNGTSTLYDLNSIPVSALERIDVFKDGASAVYGSDAIGGVINFITKQDYQGFEVSARSGANDDGKFGKRGVNIAAGVGDYKTDGYNVLLSADLSNRDRTTIREGSNDIQAAQYAAINYRLNPYNSSISSQPFFYKEKAPGALSFNTTVATAATIVNRTACDPSRLITGSTANGIISSNILYGRTFCNYDTDQFADAQNPGQDQSFISRGSFRINGDMSAFAEAGYSKTERQYAAVSRTISGTAPTTNYMVGAVGTPFQAILPIGHPDNPYTDARAAVSYRFENVRAGTELTNQQYRLLGGLKGSFGSWDWESAVLWNRTNRDETSYGFLYLPVLRQLLTGRTLASIAADPMVSVPLTNKGMAEIMQYDAKVTTQFGKLPGGPIGFAAGVEVRREALKIDPDPYNARGEILGLATTITDGSRDVKSAFFEFNAPVMKNLELDLAGRFDSYPGIATNFVPKVGGKWTALEGLAFRSSYAEGFRAPAVSQVTPGGAQYFLSGMKDPIRCPDGVNPVAGADSTDCNKSMSGVGGSNPDLKPEKSKSYALGMIFAPSNSIDVLVDWYKIRKEGEVALGSATTVLEHPDRFPADAITRDTNPLNLLKDANGNPRPGTGPLLAVATPWTNQGSTEVMGIDLEFKMRNSLGAMGKLTSSAKVAYILSYSNAAASGDVEANVTGRSGGLADWATSSGAIPKLKLDLSTSWVNGPHNLTGAMHYVSEIDQKRYTDNAISYATPTCHWGGPAAAGVGSRSILGVSPNGYIDYYPDCVVAPWRTFDVGYYYSGVKNLTLGMHIANVFDTPAPYYPGTNTSTTVLDGYYGGLHNNTGRYYTLSANYKFK